MILVDANLLLYASIASFPQHALAEAWLDEQLNGVARVALPWPSVLAFLRVATSRRLLDRPLKVADAWGQVRSWLGCDLVWIPQPTERHADVFERLLVEPGVTGNLVHDAHLAALAIEYGLELCSADSDFARFPGLRWTNPLTR